MAGFFPGIDPFLEFQANWPDFYNALITEIRNDLGSSLPGSYVARVDERDEVVIPETESPAVIVRTYSLAAFRTPKADIRLNRRQPSWRSQSLPRSWTATPRKSG